MTANSFKPGDEVWASIECVRCRASVPVRARVLPEAKERAGVLVGLYSAPCSHFQGLWWVDLLRFAVDEQNLTFASAVDLLGELV